MTFDSNVLIHAVSRSDPRHPAATELIDRAARGDCRQTLQSLAECFNVLSRKYRMPALEAYAWVQSFQRLFPVVTAEESDLDRAMRAVEDHRLSFWDAMLWATAKRAGCSVLFSEDVQNGRRLEGILFVDPFAPENRRLVDLALPERPRA
ncbi:MAG: PIN domain-containing protein [Geminicoccaceae bacterium]